MKNLDWRAISEILRWRRKAKRVSDQEILQFWKNCLARREFQFQMLEIARERVFEMMVAYLEGNKVR